MADTLHKGDTVWYISSECFFVGEIVYETFTDSEQYIVKPTTVFVDNVFALDVNEPSRISFERENLKTNEEFNKMISAYKRKAMLLLFWAKWI